VLKKGQPLVLKYRLWLHPGRAKEGELAGLWADYVRPPVAVRVR
jgi:hypothetical protein